MIKKTEKCLYCGEKMESQTAKKRFCNAKCRVYWNRMKVAADKVGNVLKVQDLTKPTNEVKPAEQPKSNYLATVEPDVQGKISEYEAELEASTSNAPIAIQRRKWLQNKIWQLKGIVK